MAVFKREYGKELGKPKEYGCSWGYAFTYRKVRYRKAGYKRKSEAVLAEQKRRQELILDAGTAAVTRYGTLKDITKKFFSYRKMDVAESTFFNEVQRLRTLLPRIGNIRMDRLTKADIRDYMVQRHSDGVCNRTINLELSQIRAMIDFAVIEGYVGKNVAKEVKNLKEDRHETRIPTDEELRRFIGLAAESRFGKQLVVWLHVRALTGMRPSESLRLDWDDIDFDHNSIRVRSTKHTGSKIPPPRYVDIHGDLKPELLEWKQHWDEYFRHRPPHNHVFFNPNKPTEQAQGFRGAFETVRKKAGLPWMTSYTLRHYFISMAVMAGIDYLTIMSWSGHKSSEMIDRVYGHLRPGHTAEQMEKIGFGLSTTK
jgi:integrase